MKTIFKYLYLVMLICVTCSCSTTRGQVIVVKSYPRSSYYTLGNGFYSNHPTIQTRYTCTTKTYELRNVCPNQSENITNVYVQTPIVNNKQENYTKDYDEKTAEYNSYEEFQKECEKRNTINPLFNISDWKVTIHFYRNSSRLERETANEINIQNVKEFLEKNPNACIIMDGYADIQTGSSEHNFKLASRRIHEVASRLLLSPYISQKQIKVNIIGDKKQIYNENKWNRCVVIYPQINNY